MLTVLAVIVLLGVPHGALDGEVARGVLRPHLGRAWFAVFAPPYLALSALVLLSWHAAPVVTLALFLAGSVWHFGSEDSGDGPLLEALVRGGLPIALPTLVQPAATVALLGGIAGVPLSGVLGLMAALLSFIPSLGMILAVIPAILLGLTVSPQMGLYVAGPVAWSATDEGGCWPDPVCSPAASRSCRRWSPSRSISRACTLRPTPPP